MSNFPDNSLLIVGHGCYIRNNSFVSKAPIHFSSERGECTTGDYTVIHEQVEDYPYGGQTRNYEHIIDFVDDLHELLNPFGVYYYRNGIPYRITSYNLTTNVKLSSIIADFEHPLSAVYVWTCRSVCTPSGGRRKNTRKKRTKRRRHKSRKT